MSHDVTVTSVTPCQDCLTVNISKVACPGGCLMNKEDPDNIISKLSHTEDYIIGIYLIILGKIILYDFLILIFFLNIGPLLYDVINNMTASVWYIYQKLD